MHAVARVNNAVFFGDRIMYFVFSPFTSHIEQVDTTKRIWFQVVFRWTRTRCNSCHEQKSFVELAIRHIEDAIESESHDRRKERERLNAKERVKMFVIHSQRLQETEKEKWVSEWMNTWWVFSLFQYVWTKQRWRWMQTSWSLDLHYSRTTWEGRKERNREEIYSRMSHISMRWICFLLASL